MILYDILEVHHSVSDDEIHKAFKRLAFKHHPDRNPDDPEGATERFKKIKAAYDVLGEPDQRNTYDVKIEREQLDSYLREQDAAAEGPGPADLVQDLSVSARVGREGGKVTVISPRLQPCKGCNGTGQATCYHCAGSGTLRAYIACRYCNAEGKTRVTDRHQCGECGSQGFTIHLTSCFLCADMTSKRFCEKCVGSGSYAPRLTVRVPAGIQTGQFLRLGGQSPHGGALYLRVGVRAARKGKVSAPG